MKQESSETRQKKQLIPASSSRGKGWQIFGHILEVRGINSKDKGLCLSRFIYSRTEFPHSQDLRV